jgi:sugar-specific transcriptional regulator TrmB
LPSSELSSAEPSFDQQYNAIHSALVENGFSDKESSIYLKLLIYGDTKAGTLARDLKLHRLDVYNALRNLQAKEIVTSTISKPMIFKAAPLQNVVEILKQNQREDLRRRTELINDLSESSEKFNRLLNKRKEIDARKGGSSNRIQILSGKRSIAERWSRYLTSAKNELLVATTERGTMQTLLMQSQDSLSARSKNEGLIVKIFTPVSVHTAKSLQDSGLAVRDLVASNSAGLCIVDKEEVMMVTEQTEDYSAEQFEESAVVLDSISIVGMIRTMFFVGWDTSPTLEEASKELNASIRQQEI